MTKTQRPIHAKVGDVVMIVWHGDDGELREFHSAPPPEVWKTRIAQAKAIKDLEHD